MKEISKTTSTVLNATNAIMSTNSDKRIWFSIINGQTDFNSYVSYKLRFRQAGSSSAFVKVVKSNSNYLVSEIAYPIVVVEENGIIYTLFTHRHL